MVTDVPGRSPLILHDDFCDPKHPTIIRIFANYRKVVAFVNNASGCLHGDPPRSPQHLLKLQLVECMHGSIVITLDLFFSQQKYWKEEICSIPIKYLDILWLSQRRSDKPGRMNVLKYMKMFPPQYHGTANQPRFHTLTVIFLNEFSIGFAI